MAAANGNDQPDLFKLCDFPSSPEQPAVNGQQNGHADGEQAPMYENSDDLDAISRRQLEEDVSAYRYDIDFTRAMLANPDITPSEIRSLHVRILDSSHHLRHCRHRLEVIEAQSRLGVNGVGRRPKAVTYRHQNLPPRTGSATPAPNGAGGKRKRAKTEGEEDETPEIESPEGTPVNGTNSSVQRLGFWKCRLCVSQKYLNAGPSRVPSEPGKWPLKDISKMMNHYLDLHTEHSPEERCRELGAALEQNQGPFEYWLTRTKLLTIQDIPATIGEHLGTLHAGQLPKALRGLHRAAATFPTGSIGPPTPTLK